MSAAREISTAGKGAPAEARRVSAARAPDRAPVEAPEVAQGAGRAALCRAAQPRGPRAVATEVLRAMGGLVLVMAAFAAALWALDGVPTWIAGEPRGVRKASTVQEAERFLRARLVLPSYFPATFSWPPRRIRFVTGTPGAVVLTVDGRNGGPGLLLAQTVGPGFLPARLLPEVQVLDRSQVAVGGARGTLSRVVEEGVVLWELAWQQGGRSMLLRSRGSAGELIRMARSAREEH
jgi:hypothetical protein